MKYAFVVMVDFPEDLPVRKIQTAIRETLKRSLSVIVKEEGKDDREVTPTAVKVTSINEN